MRLVLMAAGHGRRFGGLKQLAPVGPVGEAVMDYTVRFAEQAGYDSVVLVVREAIREEVVTHVKRMWPSDLAVAIAVQKEDRPGTAYALLSARPEIDGPFAVANADDLYEHDALAAIRRHFDAGSAAEASTTPHLLVAYELVSTVLTAAEVKRGLCLVASSGELASVVEHRVTLRSDGRFDGVPLSDHTDQSLENRTPAVLRGDELVSMNLWGFAPRILDHLLHAVAPYEPGGPGEEVLLPTVVGSLVRARRDRVQVVSTKSRCYGITHPEDVRLVREHLELTHPAADQAESVDTRL